VLDHVEKHKWCQKDASIIKHVCHDDLSISLEIENTSNQPINLLEVTDMLPIVLNQPKITPIEAIATCTSMVGLAAHGS